MINLVLIRSKGDEQVAAAHPDNAPHIMSVTRRFSFKTKNYNQFSPSTI